MKRKKKTSSKAVLAARERDAIKHLKRAADTWASERNRAAWEFLASASANYIYMRALNTAVDRINAKAVS